MVISMLKIRRPLGRLIFNMGIAIPGKTIFLIETATCVDFSLPNNVKHETLVMEYINERNKGQLHMDAKHTSLGECS